MSSTTPGGYSRQRIGIIIVASLASFLVWWWLKAAGIILVLVIGVLAWFYVSSRPSSNEVQALRASIKLSLDELDDVIAEYDEFAYSQEPDSLADRTIHRPELLNSDSDEPEIERFHYEYSTAQRYRNRMHAHLANPRLGVNQLERLLKISDERVSNLREHWFAARRAAQRKGPGSTGSN